MNKTAITLAAVLGTAIVSPAAAADIARGQKIYETHCITCHGAHGVSVTPNAPNFARGETLMQPDMKLLQSVKMGKMAQPAFFGILSDQQITDALAYARTLRK